MSSTLITSSLHYPLAYHCPLCCAPLHQEGNSLRCEQRHTFDYAKEGYVHLLPVQHKHSRAPGDDKHMIQARRQFLELGYYDSLKQQIQSMTHDMAPRRLLDIGCGEGFFSHAMSESSKGDVYGLDISKNAIRVAARKYRDVAFCIASYRQLPFQDYSMDVITRIYAPSDDAELHRVLSNDGQLIIVTPGPDHLLSLRQRIYPNVKAHEEQQTPPKGFQFKGRQRLQSNIQLSSASVLDLLEMTPFGWHASTELKTQLTQESLHMMEIDFIFSTYHKIRA